jgi:two-component system, NarL family, response regulator DevR
VGNITSVFLLCGNRLLRESVGRILNKRPDFQVAVSHAVAHDSTPEVADIQADVVVLDSLQLLAENTIFMPSLRNSRLFKCILVAMEDDQRRFLTAIRRGALGYVLQDASAAEVVTAIRAVSHGEAVCPARYARVLFDYFASHSTTATNNGVRANLGLTRREEQLIPLIEHGMTNKEIAIQLNLSEQTVKNHIHRILRKVGVENRLSISDAFQTQTLGL